MAAGPGPRWLIVVRRDRPRLYRVLREAFETVEDVAVILDRRHGERRRSGPGAPGRTPERRRGDRRQHPGARDRDLWETAGFRLIHVARDLRVYEDPASRPP